ncbi:hypothetical protein EVAR_34017_1 [Eumeta japonica]|uniref:Uncharacterized protein n=1 Tax=Eumeta variegata TaxID=151549 RepID=A0A4C1VUP8_EUMVA|nr:hypothetical protein EVAR_34017_1 [Eumeta japonica]
MFFAVIDIVVRYCYVISYGEVIRIVYDKGRTALAGPPPPDGIATRRYFTNENLEEPFASSLPRHRFRYRPAPGRRRRDAFFFHYGGANQAEKKIKNRIVVRALWRESF